MPHGLNIAATTVPTPTASRTRSGTNFKDQATSPKLGVIVAEIQPMDVLAVSPCKTINVGAKDVKA